MEEPVPQAVEAEFKVDVVNEGHSGQVAGQGQAEAPTGQGSLTGLIGSPPH